MNLQSKKQSIAGTIELINKTYGNGSVRYINDGGDQDIECSSTGSLGLDLAIGGGFPKGRIIEIFGQESSGKSTITLHAIAECQKKGGIALYVDSENSFDRKYAKALGVDLGLVLLVQESSAEKALNMVESIVRDQAADIIIIDSVAALVPQKEIDGDMGDANMGLMARLMSQALRKLTGIVHKTGVTVIFINQLRDKIGGYGSPHVTTGGNALKFYASVRLEVKRSSQVKNGEDIVASETIVKVVKNKIAPPFKTAQFQIKFGMGINKASEIIDFALGLEIISQSGKWFVVKGEKVQGRDALESLFNNTPSLMGKIEKEILKKLK